MRLMLFLVLMLICFNSSCTSFHTISLGRLDNDSLFVDCFSRKAKGIPVKMKVPSHVTVTIYEQQVLIRGENGVKLQSFSPPQYEVKTDLAYTDKVFLVDFVRPAGGSLSLSGAGQEDNVSFDDEQYFKAFQAEVKEQTMEQVTKAIDEIAGIPGSLTKKSGATGKSVSARVVNPPKNGISNLHFEDSIVAYQRFDLARPDWEVELNCFVNKYLGKCGTCPLPATGKVSTLSDQTADEFDQLLPPKLKQLN